MLQVPQVIHPEVVVWKDETQNVEVRKEGSVPQFDFPFQDHMALMEKNKDVGCGERSEVIMSS